MQWKIENMIELRNNDTKNVNISQTSSHKITPDGLTCH